MITMTFGTRPDFEQFSQAFQRECPDGAFVVRNCRHFEGSYDVYELYNVVNDACSHPDADALVDFASCVLYTLGIEWV